jgi:outer membrane receptor protein involved in Fe transport
MRMYLLFLSLFFCSLSFAQNSISGVVTDANNQPIPGANINVVGEAAGTASDFDGTFTLKSPRKPPFTISVTAVGFVSKKISVVSNGQKINVKLADEETKLNEIVVSASRTPERVIESPVTIERMGIQQVKSTTSPSFYDGLENLKEVHFNTSSLSFKSINTRGFASVGNTRFMQLVDGMDNSSPALNFVLGNLIGLSEIDVASVELLPGASSALYGANAFNGILFMNSKSPFTNEGISTYLKYGQTTQKTAGTNDYLDFGFRAAKAFTKHFAAKANFNFMRATEWIASDDRDAAGGAVGHANNPNYDGLNLYGDEASTNLRGVGTTLVALGRIPAGAINLLPDSSISRTGYREQDMNDNKVKSVKTDFSLHFKPWENDTEIILQYKLGMGSTIYQGANRYALKNFFMQQGKLEVKGKNFFVRGYVSDENAGDSYDMRFAALNVNRAWKSDNQWFGEYAGAFVQASLNPALIGGQFSDDAKHKYARAFADTGRLLPGTGGFQQALSKVTANAELSDGGAKFIDHSKIYHSDVNYNFKDIVKFAEIQVGGSWRQYVMNSEGTIFTDFDGPLKYKEYGAYTQLTKKFLAEDRLKFTGSVRYDKSQNFKGNISPRLSLVYAAGATKRHNFRASYQTGFRNPTTQDQYIGLDLGPYSLIGSAPENLSRYSEVRSVSQAGVNAGQPANVTLTGNEAYYNSFTVTSVKAFAASGNPALLEKSDVSLVKPERVQAFELGYRTVINNDLSVDVNGYYNIYNDFLNQSRVITPYYGKVGSIESVAAIINKDTRVFNLYSNSKSELTSVGFGVGLSKKVYKNFELGVNYNYADFKFDADKDPSFIPGFNTPKNRVKASLGNDKLFPNFGFNVNARWNSAYLWQASFGDGMIEENTVLDAQINYGIPKLKSVLKVGATNLFGQDYVQVIGAGSIGQQWFVSWTINP